MVGQNNAQTVNGDEEQILLAICYSRGRLGAAYYSQLTKTVFTLSDQGEDPEFALLDALFRHVRPTTVLANRNQDLQFLSQLGDLCGCPYDGSESRLEVDSEEETRETDEELEDTDERCTYEQTERSRTTSTFSSCVVEVPKRIVKVQTSETVIKKGIKEVKKVKVVDQVELEGMDSELGDQEEDSDLDEDEHIDANLLLLPNRAYRFERATKRISELFRVEDATGEEQELMVRFRIDLTMVNMVRACGALLMYMDAVRIGVAHMPLNIDVPVESVRKFTVGRHVDIDQGTFRALDIFSDAREKELKFKFSPASVDSRRLTLFSLCNMCRSGAGKVMLRRWFEHPTTDRDELSRRHHAVQYFVEVVNSDVTQFLSSKLPKVKNIRAVLRRLRMCSLKSGDWSKIHQSCRAFCSIGMFLHNRGVDLPLISHLMHLFDEELGELTVLLGSMIDFAGTDQNGRLVIEKGVDPELDFWKGALEELEYYLEEQSKIEREFFGTDEVCVIFSRAYLYVLLIPEGLFDPSHPRVDGVIFESDGVLHIKTPLMHALDEKLGDLEMRIVDKETLLTLRLQQVLRKHSRQLLGVLSATALLDAALALGNCAKQMGWVRPDMANESVIDIRNGFHPISSLICKGSFVRNHISSGSGDLTRLKVFSGPNASGKSVYLKMVGLIVYLAHIGSFVPAEAARIGPIDHIMTRMYTVDSVLDGLSTFAHDLNQICKFTAATRNRALVFLSRKYPFLYFRTWMMLSGAVTRASSNSLVIIDEFGKGTVTEVGLSLLASTLNRWIGMGSSHCPHVFVSSHFHALPKLLTMNNDVLSFHAMNASVRAGCQLVFHYRVVDGMATSSYAAYVAREMGVCDEVADRAIEVYSYLCDGAGVESISHGEKRDKRSELLLYNMEYLLDGFDSLDLESEEDVDQFIDLVEDVLITEEAIDDKEDEEQEEIENELEVSANESVDTVMEENLSMASQVVFASDNGQSQRSSMECTGSLNFTENESSRYSHMDSTSRSIIKGKSGRDVTVNRDLSVTFAVEEERPRRNVPLESMNQKDCEDIERESQKTSDSPNIEDSVPLEGGWCSVEIEESVKEGAKSEMTGGMMERREKETQTPEREKEDMKGNSNHPSPQSEIRVSPVSPSPLHLSTSSGLNTTEALDMIFGEKTKDTDTIPPLLISDKGSEVNMMVDDILKDGNKQKTQKDMVEDRDLNDVNTVNISTNCDVVMDEKKEQAAEENTEIFNNKNSLEGGQKNSVPFHQLFKNPPSRSRTLISEPMSKKCSTSEISHERTTVEETDNVKNKQISPKTVTYFPHDSLFSQRSRNEVTITTSSSHVVNLHLFEKLSSALDSGKDTSVVFKAVKRKLGKSETQPQVMVTECVQDIVYESVPDNIYFSDEKESIVNEENEQMEERKEECDVDSSTNDILANVLNECDGDGKRPYGERPMEVEEGNSILSTERLDEDIVYSSRNVDEEEIVYKEEKVESKRRDDNDGDTNETDSGVESIKKTNGRKTAKRRLDDTVNTTSTDEVTRQFIEGHIYSEDTPRPPRRSRKSIDL